MAISLRSHTSYGSGNNETSSTITAPSGIQNDDILLLWVNSSSGTNQTITPPSGFTLIDRTDDGTAEATASYWKRASSESGNYTVTVGTSAEQSMVMAAYSGCTTLSTPVDVHNAQVNASGTSCTAPSVTTTLDNDQLVFFGANYRGGITTWTAPSGEVRQEQINGVDNGNVCFCDEALGAAGATGDKVATQNNANRNVGQLVALSPAPVTPPLMKAVTVGGLAMQSLPVGIGQGGITVK